MTQNKLPLSSPTDRKLLGLLLDRSDPPVRNQYMSPEASGMYIQRGAKVRVHSRRLAARDGIKLLDRDLVDRQERCRVGAWDQPWPRAFYPRVSQ